MTITGAGLQVKGGDEVNKAKISDYKDSLSTCKSTPVKPIIFYDTVMVHDTITQIEKHLKERFKKPSMTVTSTGHMVLDRTKGVYRIPIKNDNPDSVNMLNDSLDEPINIKVDPIRVEPQK